MTPTPELPPQRTTYAERRANRIDALASASAAEEGGVSLIKSAWHRLRRNPVFLVGLAGGLGHERCAQIGSVLAAHVLETVGTQEYDVTRTGFLERFGDAYGDEAVQEIAPLVRCARD